MHILPESPEAIDAALTVLQSGGIVIHATETCYGIACDLTNPKAVEKLFRVKKRPPDQPVSALFPSMSKAEEYVDFSPRALELAKKYLPGPLTIVLPSKADSPNLFVMPSPPAPLPVRPHPGGPFRERGDSFPSPRRGEELGVGATIGIRISSFPLAQILASRFGKPMATTSANLHGLPNPYSVADIQLQLADQQHLPDLFIDSGSLPIAPPSTVIEVIGQELRVLRKGEIAIY